MFYQGPIQEAGHTRKAKISKSLKMKGRGNEWTQKDTGTEKSYNIG